MSETFINSFGNINKPLSDVGVWKIPADFNIPNDVDVNSTGGITNFLPFSVVQAGLEIPGMVNGVFTVPVGGIYSISFVAFGTGTDNGAGNKRICQIVLADDNKNAISGNNNVPIINGSAPKFGDTFTGFLKKNEPVIAGIVQDSGLDYVIAGADTFIMIIKLFDFDI